MQKKYPTNFLDPLDISEYDSNSTKDSLAYAIAPLPTSSAGGLFSHYVYAVQPFLISTATTARSHNAAKLPHRRTFGLINKLI